jgi:hypothetical protein
LLAAQGGRIQENVKVETNLVKFDTFALPTTEYKSLAQTPGPDLALKDTGK